MKSLKKTFEPSLEVDAPEAVSYPSLHVDAEQMPEIKDWKVGETYKVTFSIKMVEASEFSFDDQMRASFDLHEYETTDN